MKFSSFLSAPLVLSTPVLGGGGGSGNHEFEDPDDDYQQGSSTKPNFVFIMTDDQDLHLSSLDYQAAVQTHLVKRGTLFKKHFCTVSLCCPSRVSLLTGKAAHNTNVTNVALVSGGGGAGGGAGDDAIVQSNVLSISDKRERAGGYPKFIAEGLNDAYLPVWLQAAGYNTYYTGKLMNSHSTATYNKPFPRGWNRSDFLLDPGTYRYFDAIMSLDNAAPRSTRHHYSTDVIADRALEFLGDAIDAGRQRRPRRPFFLAITPIGPHANVDKGGAFEAPIPARRHSHLFPDVKVPRSPNFNPDTAGNVSYLKHLPRLSDSQITYGDAFYRARLQALQSVDELVARVVAELERHPDVLANTYIIYTSDNGYHIGQHRLPPGKTCNIDEDVNVPLVVRGPGVPAGREVAFPTSHTDIVPTLFVLAGLPLHEDFDGAPFPVTAADNDAAAGGGRARQHRGRLGPNTYKTLRVVGEAYEFMYAVWCTNEHQLYDMRRDPHQLHNLYGRKHTLHGWHIAALSARLDTLLLTLKDCSGQRCRRPWQAIFPQGQVRTLRDAMDDKYDDFFQSQQKVAFQRCTLGYLPEFEGGTAGPLAYYGPDTAVPEQQPIDRS
ncbi:arylsulfatase precursor [Moelleriella libera RCEF 2490]|uniref:Arylsulfatase n=1 Tax=Moelleriella libera RCEF 2490 TaxID=1081109 RepID=A0A168BMJ7_9HYPO|nr:arylsulfatase precursor [Moelleriella libera RCEF 2490]